MTVKKYDFLTKEKDKEDKFWDDMETGILDDDEEDF